MRYFPTPRPLRHTFVYAVVLLILVLVVGTTIYSSGYEFDILVPSVLLVFGIFVLAEYRRRTEFGFDPLGVYRFGKLLFGWTGVRKISFSFKESKGSVPMVAAPTWRALLSGPIVSKEEWISYGISTVFTLEDGSSFAIPSNLDKMTTGHVIEEIHEVAKSANPSIEIE